MTTGYDNEEPPAWLQTVQTVVQPVHTHKKGSGTKHRPGSTHTHTKTKSVHRHKKANPLHSHHHGHHVHHDPSSPHEPKHLKSSTHKAQQEKLPKPKHAGGKHPHTHTKSPTTPKHHKTKSSHPKSAGGSGKAHHLDPGTVHLPGTSGAASHHLKSHHVSTTTRRHKQKLPSYMKPADRKVFKKSYGHKIPKSSGGRGKAHHKSKPGKGAAGPGENAGKRHTPGATSRSHPAPGTPSTAPTSPASLPARSTSVQKSGKNYGYTPMIYLPPGTLAGVDEGITFIQASTKSKGSHRERGGAATTHAKSSGGRAGVSSSSEYTPPAPPLLAPEVSRH